MRTICSKSLNCSCRAKSARVGDAHDSNQDDGVEDGRERLDASKLNCNDERGVARRGTFGSIQFAVLWDDQANEEKVDDVEDGDTPDDLLRGPGDLLSRIDGFRSSQSGQLSASIGEGRSHEDTAEAVKAVEECLVRCMPVSKH